ncbi:SspB family protein [Rhizosaccharibacter radicis]|uniref:ClpXP protease specificity-enhancing factor SspB n=1 Tax=Rhizosaccharibacter radicis TaxID=2782605 RepID=A0ABT1VWD8_9PROT|nr:ClpXP protease specificity-enhancing factor SspB [Acetobacteraceae bacterium KSS12]
MADDDLRGQNGGPASGQGTEGRDGGDGDEPVSLLPYESWIEQAYRTVMIRALKQVAAEGLPGAHHFYVTFRTTHPGVAIPKRLSAQYPQEMTIVLQHQFWDLTVDEDAGLFSVGLSFGGVPSTLVIPLGAVVGFADPQVRLALRFSAEAVEEIPEEPEDAAEASPAAAEADASLPEGPAPDPTPQVVSLDAFRKRGGN